jgi:copper(I)-binding protein
MMRLFLVFLLFLAPFLSYANLEIEDATVRLLPPGVPNTSAYFMLKNKGNESISIVSASSDIARKVELHAHIMEDEVMSMVKQDEVLVKAGESVHFQPGGFHLMMFGLQRPLKKDELIDIQLVTSEGEHLAFKAKVQEPSVAKHKHH